MIDQKILTGVIFVICFITDMKGRKIYKGVLAGYLLLSLLGHAAGGTFSVQEAVLNMVPGAVCLLLSWVSRQALGYGDSLLITVCGIALGAKECIGILITAFFWSGIWAVLLLCLKGSDRNKEFPFMPFLLLGMLQQSVFG